MSLAPGAPTPQTSFKNESAAFEPFVPSALVVRGVYLGVCSTITTDTTTTYYYYYLLVLILPLVGLVLVINNNPTTPKPFLCLNLCTSTTSRTSANNTQQPQPHDPQTILCLNLVQTSGWLGWLGWLGGACVPEEHRYDGPQKITSNPRKITSKVLIHY